MASLDLLENGCIAVMLWTASSCHMPLFDFYIMVDWSGGDSNVQSAAPYCLAEKDKALLEQKNGTQQ
jgi:hypothetical protein